MTAKIISFDAKKKKEPVPPELSLLELYQDTMDEVLGQWQHAASIDQLNEYITSKIPAKFRNGEHDYVGNLNSLARIELLLDMNVVVYYPTCTKANLVGWLASFRIKNNIFASPPDMATEGYARAINIILYIVFKHHLKTLKRTI
jgi:hypothetical protein